MQVRYFLSVAEELNFTRPLKSATLRGLRANAIELFVANVRERYSLACGTKDDDMELRTQSGDYRGGVPMKTLQKYRASSEIDSLDERSDVERPDIAPDLSPPEVCRQRAEECLNLSYQITDPKGQVAVLKLANWWMRLAENYYSRTATRHKASA
jgi:hypothetical protein